MKIIPQARFKTLKELQKNLISRKIQAQNIRDEIYGDGLHILFDDQDSGFTVYRSDLPGLFLIVDTGGRKYSAENWAKVIEILEDARRYAFRRAAAREVPTMVARKYPKELLKTLYKCKKCGNMEFQVTCLDSMKVELLKKKKGPMLPDSFMIDKRVVWRATCSKCKEKIKDVSDYKERARAGETSFGKGWFGQSQRHSDVRKV